MQIATASRTTELIISRRAWHNALRTLLLDQHPCAVADVRRAGHDSKREMLVERFDIEPDPRGEQRPPLADWCLLAVASEGDADPQLWLERAAPRRSQWLAAIVLSPKESGEMRCQAAVYDQGKLTTLEGIQIVGAKMLRLAPEGVPELDPLEQSGRWSRTRGALGASVVERLKASTITLVGAGRNGTLAAWQLAALGVSKLRIIDADMLQPHNLDAMVGLSADMVGTSKAVVLSEHLLRFRPDMAITVLTKSVTDPQAVALLRHRSDLMFTCVDNDLARLVVSQIARETLTVHLDVGTSVQRDGQEPEITADVRLFLPGEGCVACVGGVNDLDDVLYNFAAPPGALQRGTPRQWFEERAGSLVTINSMAVGAAVQSWLDLLGGQLDASLWQRFSWRSGAGLQSESGTFDASDECVFCHRF